MKRRPRTLIRATLGLLLLTTLAGLIAQAQQVPGVTDTTIKLGMFVSSSGPQAYQSAALDGVKTWVDEVNAAGGIDGRTIQLVSYDDESSVQQAQSDVRRLISQDHVFALICGSGSSQTLAVLDLVRSEGVPFVTCISAASGVIKPGDPYVFRIYANEQAQADAVVRYAATTLGYKRPAIIYNSSAFGVQGFQFMQAALKNDYQEDFVASAKYNVGDQDFRSQLLRLSEAKPDVIIVNGFANDSGLIVRQARQLGITLPMIGGGGTPTPLFPQAAGQDAVGFPAVWVFPVLPSDTSGPVEAFKQLELKYVLSNGYPPGRPSLYDLTGYIAGKVVQAGLQRAGRDLTRADFIKALESLKDFNPAGIGFPITFTNGHEGTSQTAIVKVNQKLQWEFAKQ